MNVVFIGAPAFGNNHIGKSTLIGHLLSKVGAIDQRTIERCKQEAEHFGLSSRCFAWLLNKDKLERLRGETIHIHQA